MFRGINEITMDAKGRLSVPARYREALSQQYHNEVVVTIDIDETCLLLYPRVTWQVIEEKLQSLPSFNPAARRVQRLLIGHATDMELDGNGRLLLPPELRAYAKLEKNVVMIGQGNKFEVWDKATWEGRRGTWLDEAASDSSILPAELQIMSL